MHHYPVVFQCVMGVAKFIECFDWYRLGWARRNCRVAFHEAVHGLEIKSGVRPFVYYELDAGGVNETHKADNTSDDVCGWKLNDHFVVQNDNQTIDCRLSTGKSRSRDCLSVG